MPDRPHLRRLLAAGLTLASVAGATACASSGSSTGSQSATRSNASRPNVLTAEDIQKAHIANVYDLVSSLRPRWLQTRGVDSFQRPSEIQVYLGNTRMNGGISGLRDISSLGVTKIEYVDPISASSRWGLDHGAGAIVVSLSTP
jgi:hypothetical protein